MGFLSNPKLPYFVRIGQLAIAIGFLILICYSGTHRGWWRNINGAIAVGGKQWRCQSMQGSNYPQWSHRFLHLQSPSMQFGVIIVKILSMVTVKSSQSFDSQSKLWSSFCGLRLRRWCCGIRVVVKIVYKPQEIDVWMLITILLVIYGQTIQSFHGISQ